MKREREREIEGEENEEESASSVCVCVYVCCLHSMKPKIQFGCFFGCETLV